MDAFIAIRERDFCGVVADAGEQLMQAELQARTIAVPVLLVFGDSETDVPGGNEYDLASWMAFGNDDVSLAIIPNAAHMITMERTAPSCWATMNGWLAERGF